MKKMKNHVNENHNCKHLKSIKDLNLMIKNTDSLYLQQRDQDIPNHQTPQPHTQQSQSTWNIW